MTLEYYDTTFQEISKQLESGLFNRVTKLRLFTVEGVELFEEDMKYLKPSLTLMASNGTFKILSRWKRFRRQTVPSRI
jgi:hypothetical protein